MAQRLGEGRRQKEEGRRKKEEGRRKREEGRGKKAIKVRVSVVKNVLTVLTVVIVFQCERTWRSTEYR